MLGAALPPREPGAGSTIPFLPLQRLLLAGTERELAPPGSRAASFSSFSRPTFPESRLRGSGNSSRREEVQGEQTLTPTFKSSDGVAEWSKTCIAPLCPASLPPAPGEERLWSPHLQTSPRSLSVWRGPPPCSPGPPPLRGWSQPLSGDKCQ